MSYFNEVYERILQGTNAHTQMELANLLGIRQSSISDARRRGSVPADWYVKMHDRFGLNIDWLRWGMLPVYSKDKIAPSDEGGDEGAAGGLREDPAPAISSARGVLTRVLDTACEYRDGDALPEFVACDQMVFPHTLMGEGMLVFCVRAGGMEPTLRKGAFVGVATSQRQIISGEVYALLVPHEGVAFRRIVRDSESGLFLLCFDQAGLPHTRVQVKTLQNRILGRALWALQPV